MSSKTDWKLHQVNYAENYVHLGISVAAYAREYDLNLNSARRAMGGKDEINKLRMDIKAGAHPTYAQMKAKGQRPLDRKSDRSGSDHQAKSDHSDRSATQGDRSAKPGATRPSKRSQQGAKDARGAIGNADQKKGNRGATRPNNPNTVTVIHGDYADPLEIDRELFDLAMSIAHGNDDLVISQSRHLLMVRNQNSMYQSVVRDYDAGKPWRDPETGSIIPRAQAEYQAIYGPASKIAELEAIIGQRKRGIAKQRLADHQQAMAEREAHPLTLAERITYTRQFMDRRDAEGLTAIETARLFEREGISLPRSLQVELAREVSWMEPLVDAAGGVTDEELEAQSREYLEKQRHITEAWLPARREEVSAALAAELATQAGDMLQEDDFEENPEEAWIDLDNDLTDDIEVWE